MFFGLTQRQHMDKDSEGQQSQPESLGLRAGLQPSCEVDTYTHLTQGGVARVLSQRSHPGYAALLPMTGDDAGYPGHQPHPGPASPWSCARFLGGPFLSCSKSQPGPCYPNF